MKERTALTRNALLFVLILISGMLGACTSSASEPTVSPTEVPLPTNSPTEVPLPTTSPTDAPPTPAATSEPNIEEETANPKEGAVNTEEETLTAGDPERGQEIFLNGGSDELYKPESACAKCHSLDGTVSGADNAGPSLLGVSDRAGERVPGLSPEEYLRQSIEDPAAFVAPTYKNRMNKMGAKYLNAQELEDLVAFLLSLSGETAPTDKMPAQPEMTVDIGMIVEEGQPTRGKIMAASFRCLACHMDDETDGYGPRFSSTDELPAIWERGELRISDSAYAGQATTNQEYILESIFLTEAYFVPGEWPDVMPNGYHNYLSGEDLANIMAWLESIE